MKNNDRVFASFLECQWADASAFASDVVRIHGIGQSPPQHFVAEFHCNSVVRNSAGQIHEARRAYVAGIFFPDDYLRRAEVPQVITWLEPTSIYHPNIAPPFV